MLINTMKHKEFNWNLVVASFLMVTLMVGVGARIYANARDHSHYENDFRSACLEKGGIKVTISSGRGWPKYVCFNSQDVIDMGSLESSYVDK